MAVSPGVESSGIDKAATIPQKQWRIGYFRWSRASSAGAELTKKSPFFTASSRYSMGDSTRDRNEWGACLVVQQFFSTTPAGGE
jgi:hypothetical protein